jgi:PAS domain-containing protein
MVVTYFNPAAERMLSRKGTEVLGKAVFRVFPKAKGSILDDKCRQAMKKKAVLSFETRLEFAPDPGPYDVRVYPQADGISVFFRIISERPTTPGPKTTRKPKP